MHDPNHEDGDLYQYVCNDCGYQREGLLDRDNYDTRCPRCDGPYNAINQDGEKTMWYNVGMRYEQPYLPLKKGMFED
jgi:hypothetical protein